MPGKAAPSIEEITPQVLPILQRHHVVHASVFGSFARGEQTEKSDLDLLVEFDPQFRISLLDLSGLKIDLEDALGREVDVVSTGAKMHPLVRESISEDLKPLL